MGACSCGLNEETRNYDVRIDHKVEVIDKETHRRKVMNIDMQAVHGHIASATLEHGQTTGNRLWLCGKSVLKQGNQLALQIMGNAGIMAEAVSQEKDVLDGDWHGVNEQDPLLMLLGVTDNAACSDAVFFLANSVEKLSADESSLNSVDLPAQVYGDLHGQFRDLLLFLHHFGFPSATSSHIVFNGDWVDRGKHQLETISLVYALKLAFPDKVWLNRGNHEDTLQNVFQGASGFNTECINRFGAQMGNDVFEAFGRSFNQLPLASIISGSIFVVHGGIGDGQWDIDYLKTVERPMDHDAMAHDAIVYNALWSDPVDEDKPDSFGVHDSPRDNHSHIMKTFGADVTKSFCQRNRLRMIIRSHEARKRGDGYEVMHDEHLVRVFSARDYGHGKMLNDGSIVSITVNSSAKSLVVTPMILQSLTKDGSMKPHHSHSGNHGNHQKKNH